MARKTMLVAAPVGLIALLLLACSGAPDGETAQATAEAYTPMPEGVCTLVAGSDPARISGNAWPSTRAQYPGSDPNVLAFESEVRSRGGIGTWWVSGYGTSAWLAIDVSSTARTVDTSLANQWGNVSPVFAGYFTCNWLWGDFPLPRNGQRPYVPTQIMVFDPNCTKMHCAI